LHLLIALCCLFKVIFLFNEFFVYSEMIINVIKYLLIMSRDTRFSSGLGLFWHFILVGYDGESRLGILWIYEICHLHLILLIQKICNLLLLGDWTFIVFACWARWLVLYSFKHTSKIHLIWLYITWLIMWYVKIHFMRRAFIILLHAIWLICSSLLGPITILFFFFFIHKRLIYWQRIIHCYAISLFVYLCCFFKF